MIPRLDTLKERRSVLIDEENFSKAKLLCVGGLEVFTVNHMCVFLREWPNTLLTASAPSPLLTFDRTCKGLPGSVHQESWWEVYFSRQMVLLMPNMALDHLCKWRAERLGTKRTCDTALLISSEVLCLSNICRNSGLAWLQWAKWYMLIMWVHVAKSFSDLALWFPVLISRLAHHCPRCFSERSWTATLFRRLSHTC